MTPRHPRRTSSRRTKTPAAAVIAALAVILVTTSTGCQEMSPRTRVATDAGSADGASHADALVLVDGGSTGDLDAWADPGGLAPTLELAMPMCRDLSASHGASDPLFGFDVRGRPDARVELWAARPSCDVTPFLFRTVDLDDAGRAELRVEHPGTPSCSDNLLGEWIVEVRDGAMRSEPVSLRFSSSACASLGCDAARTFCPPPAGSSTEDAGVPTDAGSGLDGGGARVCEVAFEMPGHAHTSTLLTPLREEYVRRLGGSTWRRAHLALDVDVAGWSPKEGQYQVFTLLVGTRWVGSAIGYGAFTGPMSRGSVTVANLGLDGAAAPDGMPDGRRVRRTHPVVAPGRYHFDYVYDTWTMTRRLVITDAAGAPVTTLEAAAVVDRIDIEREGLRVVLGGEEVEGTPEAPTEGWTISDVRVELCR